MAISVVPVPEYAHGKYAVASVKFIDGVGRWKLQLGSHHAGFFCFTDRVHLARAEVLVDHGLLLKKIREPDSGHMFIFMVGVLAPYEELPADARRIGLATRWPSTPDEAYFKHLDDGSIVGAFEHFYGDENGAAWVR